jgi:glycosyltransferase involved in cell wall biosynthesis
VPGRGERPISRSHPRTSVLIAIKGLGHGGAERLLVDTVASGDHEAFEYEVAFVLSAADALVPAISANGTPVHDLGAASNVDLRWLLAFRRLLSRGNFDIVHFHLPYTAALGRLVVATLPRRRRPVTIYTEHSLWNKVAVLVKWLNRTTVSRDRALIAVSPAAYDALPGALRRRAQVVVHGVDLSPSSDMISHRHEIRREVREALGTPPDAVLVVTVANLRSEKGYDVLLDAAQLVAQRHLPLRFAAAGQGSLRAELEARAHELGLDDRFQFLGHREDALRLITAADIFVLASRQEGLPVALMEATSVGAAIVATSVGGVPLVIKDRVNGVIVPPGDPKGLADALERVGADPELRGRLGAQALKDSAAFDVARSSHEIEDIYRRVLADR